MIDRLKRAFKALKNPPPPVAEEQKREPSWAEFQNFMYNYQMAPHATIQPQLGGYIPEAMEKTLSPAHRDVWDTKIKTVLDSANANTRRMIAQDDFSIGDFKTGQYPGMSPFLLRWYASQTFIGHTACALLSQNWLMQRICNVPAEDALRNSFYLTTEDGETIEKADLAKIATVDKKFKLNENLIDAERYRRIFGVRVVLFKVNYDNPDVAYAQPFNIDGVKKGAYQGMVQIDPQWITPEFSAENMLNPASGAFYEPDYWSLPGQKIHKSHYVVLRYAKVPDVLKSSYFYGGLPLTQLAMERIYAAERGSNDLAELMLSKRTISLKTDTDAMVANPQKFFAKIEATQQLKNNHGIFVHGLDEEISQQNTPLTDSDDVVMSLYQLVASIASMPVTKLLGTTPKGFNATGENEIDSYNSSLGVIQTQTYNPIIQKHYEIAFKSEGIDINHPVVRWEPLGEENALEQAQTRLTEAQRLSQLQDTGAIDAEDIRDTLIKDRNSLLELTPKDMLTGDEEDDDIDLDGVQAQNTDKEEG